MSPVRTITCLLVNANRGLYWANVSSLRALRIHQACLTSPTFSLKDCNELDFAENAIIRALGSQFHFDNSKETP